MAKKIEMLESKIASIESGSLETPRMITDGQDSKINELIASFERQSSRLESRILELEQDKRSKSSVTPSSVTPQTTRPSNSVVPGANWTDVARRGSSKSKKTFTSADTGSNESSSMPPRSNNVYEVLNESNESDDDLPIELIQEIKRTTPREQVSQRISSLKEARKMVRPSVPRQSQASGELCHVYVNKLYRKSYGQMRNVMKAANIFMKNIKDLNWCGKSTLEILTFKSYESQLKGSLNMMGWCVIEQFDLTTPADPQATEESKEITFSQAARHFARTIYKRQVIDIEPTVVEFQLKYVESKGQRFKKAVENFMALIQEKPEAYFPFMNTGQDNNVEIVDAPSNDTIVVNSSESVTPITTPTTENVTITSNTNDELQDSIEMEGIYQ